jgi:hypothetical protein
MSRKQAEKALIKTDIMEDEEKKRYLLATRK